MSDKELEFEKKILEFENKLSELREIASSFNTDLSLEIRAIEKQLLKEKKLLYSKLTPWQKVLISNNSQRPRSSDYINTLMGDRVELFGDRIFGDDPAIIGGLANFKGYKVVFLGQEKGRDTKERIAKNFGYMHPEGYRKALRIMRLAEKFSKPIISFVDTPGADPSVSSELRGQHVAIAENIGIMSVLKVPIISVVIGEGGSGGALGVGVSDKILMLENSIYMVCKPETCSEILRWSSNRVPEAASALKLTADDLKELGIVDEVIREPLGGAHRDPGLTISRIGRALKKNLDELTPLNKDELIKRRYQKYRQIGAVT